MGKAGGRLKGRAARGGIPVKNEERPSEKVSDGLSSTLLASSTQMDTISPSFLLTFPFTKRIYFHINTLPKNYCRLCMYGRQTRSPIKINIKRFTNPLIITSVVPPNIIRASNNQYNQLKWVV
ncbi:hypothetical protein NEICINOT_04060 [Neisseria cinerea ATCC 14685]|uniref:Uncharacterized protein n=1 Tax=Neisseria cinerea ATCC 14685 TaxID=546262 RepID=D0W325_NEICI|nr:hypothetical protein NEICINOT_04060 [Neisseria cinerea ATCC 14685]